MSIRGSRLARRVRGLCAADLRRARRSENSEISKISAKKERTPRRLGRSARAEGPRETKKKDS